VVFLKTKFGISTFNAASAASNPVFLVYVFFVARPVK
jgi:hypothetical protein